MSEPTTAELIKRLRCMGDGLISGHLMSDAAQRLESLEAALAEEKRRHARTNDSYFYLEDIAEKADKTIHEHLRLVGRPHGKPACMAFDGIDELEAELAQGREAQARVKVLEGALQAIADYDPSTSMDRCAYDSHYLFEQFARHTARRALGESTT